MSFLLFKFWVSHPKGPGGGSACEESGPLTYTNREGVVFLTYALQTVTGVFFSGKLDRTLRHLSRLAGVQLQTLVVGAEISFFFFQ